MEASSPAKRGDTGRFVSEELTVNPNYKFCVDFWYHMFGDGAGALRVRTRFRSQYSDGRKVTSTKWTMEGNQGNEWRHAQVNITIHTDFQVCLLLPSIPQSVYHYRGKQILLSTIPAADSNPNHFGTKCFCWRIIFLIGCATFDRRVFLILRTVIS